ncbi:MAG TPA: hypothetical protein DCS97_12285 [Planctomycetes bacterium]|nr:hypothetical protein [Planctomycetota bacterium]
MKRVRASDRVILAMREQLLRSGWVECVQIHGRLRVATARYGPAHARVRVRIRPGNGRPRPGEIGLIAALADRTGYSRFVIQRAVAGSPRAGTRRLPSVDPPAELRPADTYAGPGVRGLDAIGVIDVTERNAPPRPTVADAGREAIRQSLAESLAAALSTDVVPDNDRTAAERLLQTLSHQPDAVASPTLSQKM